MHDISNEIIQSAQAGDIQAFEKLYRHYSSAVYSICLGIMKNEADAQDATQDVFITLFHKLKDFRFESALKTWVYRIAVNTSLNMRKKRARIEDPLVELTEESPFGSKDGDGRSRISQDEQVLVIMSFLDKLNLEQKTCLLLRSVEGLSYQEIAETLNININTVRSRIRRARRILLALKNEVRVNEL